MKSINRQLASMVLGLIGMFCFSGCVHYGQFRNDRLSDGSAPPICGPSGDLSKKELSKKSTWCPGGTGDKQSNYYLAFIEVDDFGELFDRGQLTRAMTLIQTAKHNSPTGNAIVVTFIHGWKNNSSDDSGNVWGFRDALNELAGSLAEERKEDPELQEPVVGVYIGWRGAVTNVPVLREFTFYDRRNAAIRIPGAHLTEVLSEIAHEAKSCIERCQPNDTTGPGTGSLSVIVGHSFGGMVLERSLTQAIVGDLLNQEAQRKDGQRRGVPETQLNDIKPPADLIVMVNEAAPATEAKQLLDLLKKHKMKLIVDGREEPLFLSITSMGDSATAILMPLGQGPSKLTKSFRKYDFPDPPAIPNQSTYYLHSTAHLSPLWSHVLGREDAAPIQSSISSLTSKEREDDVRCFDSKVLKHRYCIAPVPDRYNDTPYWVMQMGTEFVPDHSQIFRSAFRELLAQFVRQRIDMTQSGTPSKPATIQIAPPKK